MRRARAATAAAILRMLVLGLAALLPATAPVAAGDPPGSRWTEQRGDARELALTPSGEAWALDPQGQVWRLPEGAEASSWNRMPGRFARLRATQDGSVWGIGDDGRLYRLERSVWRELRPGVRDVAASPDGEAWLLLADGAVVSLDGGRPLEPPPPSGAEARALLADQHGLLWLLRIDGSAQRHDGRSWQTMRAPDEPLGAVAIGLDGTTLGLGHSGRLWRYAPESARWFVELDADLPPLRALAVDGQGQPWVVSRQGRILASRMQSAPESPAPPPALFTRLLSWRAVGGMATQLSLAGDGSVYGLDADGAGWRRQGEQGWTHLGGRFTAIAAGGATRAWALDAEQRLYQLDGRGWLRLPASAEAIGSGPGDQLWGLLPGPQIARWDAGAQRWQPRHSLPFAARAFAIGPDDQPWLIDAQGGVQTLAGGQWRALPDLQARSLAVGREGSVYATAGDGSIHWLDRRESAWKPATGRAQRIAVGASGAPWAIAPDGQLLASARFLEEDARRAAEAARLAQAGKPPELLVLPAWPLPTLTRPLSYQVLAGPLRLRDLGIGADGSIFGVGGGGELYCFSNADQRFLLASRGRNARVGVATSGAPWVVSSEGIVSRFERGAWQPVPEFTAVDVAGGPDGKIWAAGTDGGSYLYNPRLDRFELQPVTGSDRRFRASRIAGGNAGVSFVVSEERQLFRCEKGVCRLALLAATDVAVSPDNLPFALDALGALQRFNPRSRVFERQNGLGIALAVGPQGLPWLVQSNGQVQQAGLIFPRSRTINTAGCAAPFARAAVVGAAPAGVLRAAPDTASLPPGSSLDLLANDRIAARAPTLADVTLRLDARDSGLSLDGGSVRVPTQLAAGAVLVAGYQLCPRQGFAACASAEIRIAVTAALTVPGAPTALLAVAGNAQATLDFRAPASDGGAAVLRYTAISVPGGLTATAAVPPLTVSGLDNGTSYRFTVRAENAVGSGPASEPSNAVTPGAPAMAPGAPTGVVATAGNGEATVQFDPPVSSGGLPVTGYTVTSVPGGLTASGAGAPLVVGGLDNGSSYRFIVTARNAAGPGPASSPSNAVTPATVPGAPTGVVATADDAQAIVRFTPPASDGGAPVLRYTAVSSPGGFTATGSGAPLIVRGLSNGVGYTFTVRAANALGEGPASAPSDAVVPDAAVSVPDAPTAVAAVAGNAQATVSFSAPTSNGGAPITGYTVRSSPGGFTATGNASPLVVAGLVNGVSYVFRVTATNAAGDGAASAPSNAVTPGAPATVPAAPTGVSAAAGNGQATVNFSPPNNDGGAPISSYTVTSNPGGLTATGGGSPLNVSGLSNGISYTFTVRATNAVGAGAASTASNAVTPSAPAMVPGAPTGVSALAGNAQATVNFSPPNSDGGAPISSYTVTSSPGGLSATGASASLTVGGLSNGTSYTFTVRATNAVGTGAASTASNAVTPSAPVTAPGAPNAVSATAGNTLASVSFAAPASDGGSPVTSYTATSSPDGLTATGNGSPLTVSGLTNGISYTFTVRATNAVGTGPASAASNPVTPASPPGPPIQVSGIPGDSQVSVNFFGPASNGGSPITGFTAVASPGGQSATGSAAPLVVTGLTNGVSYTFTVSASNAIGAGPPSMPSNPVTPTP